MFCTSCVCCLFIFVFFFKQKTAYEMRISDWSSDVCSSDLMAVGYTFESEKIFCHDGVVTRAPTVEHVPPSTTAQIFWLKNRRRDLWRDRIDSELTGKDGDRKSTRLNSSH